MRLSRPLVGLATVAVLATGALSGCGIADAEVRPGTAAVVEGEEISLSDVDDATEATCEVLQGSQELRPFPAVAGAAPGPAAAPRTQEHPHSLVQLQLL